MFLKLTNLWGKSDQNMRITPSNIILTNFFIILIFGEKYTFMYSAVEQFSEIHKLMIKNTFFLLKTRFSDIYFM